MERIEIVPRAAGFPADLGCPDLPASKSHAQRAMLLGAAAGGVLLRGPLRCDDTEILARALRALGVGLEWRDAGLWIEGGLRPGVRGTVQLGENGTALRLLTVAVAMLEGELGADGAAGLRRRPLGPVLELLAQAGVQASAGALPLQLDATAARWPAVLSVDARVTTQPASGALIGWALRARHGLGGGELRVSAPSAPGYLEVTAQLLEVFGHRVRRGATAPDSSFTVAAAVAAAPAEYEVPPDASAAAFPLALAALHGRDWSWPGAADDPHPDVGLTADLARLADAAPGARVELAELSRRPDSVPALAVVAAARDGTTVFEGLPALRAKESDRIRAMCVGLHAAGVRCDEREDGFDVHGPLRPAPAMVELPAPADHRIVMALALLGTLLPAGVALPHAEAVAKSWPGFWSWLRRVADVRRR